MATFDELAKAATAITGRQDVYQSGAVFSLLGQLIARVSTFGKLGEDYRETEVVLDEPTYYATLDSSQIDPAGEGIRTYEIVQIHKTPLEALLPRDVLMSPDCLRMNSYYRKGSNLELIFDKEFTEVLVGFYVQPPIVTAAGGNGSHWTTEVFYNGLIAGLCGAIYRQVGDKDSYAMYEGEFQTLFALFRAERSDGEAR